MAEPRAVQVFVGPAGYVGTYEPSPRPEPVFDLHTREFVPAPAVLRFTRDSATAERWRDALLAGQCPPSA